MSKKELKIAGVEKIAEKVQKDTVSRPVRRYRTVAVQTYLTIGVGLFIVLALLARMFPYFPIDLAITRGIQMIHVQWFDYLMKAVSYIGFGPQVDVLIGVIVVFLFVIGLRWEATVGLLDAVSITVVGLLIKDIIGRPRPTVDLVHVFSHLTETSFPSGHVTMYTAFFGYLWFLTYSHLKNSTHRTILLIIFALLIVLIAPSRIYLGAHWASDTLGAYLLGSIWLLLTIRFYHWGKKRFFLKQPTAPEKGTK